MKHLCKNFMNRHGVCDKCITPEWALCFDNPFKIGDIVRTPIHYHNGGETLKIVKELKDGSYGLETQHGGYVESYFWWELRPTKKLTLTRA